MKCKLDFVVLVVIYLASGHNAETAASTSNGELKGDLLPAPGVCGAVTDRANKPNASIIGEYPWLALLEYTKSGTEKNFHCIGALINSRYVLTSAHCVAGKIPKTLELTGVRLGEWDLNTESDCENDLCADPVKNIPVEEKVPHENYASDSKSQIHDIALLRLAENVEYTDWIKPICLPRAEHLKSNNYVGDSMHFAGWGKIPTMHRTNLLSKAQNNVVDFDECKNVYKQLDIVLEATQICTDGQNRTSPCVGDGGGPLMGIDQNVNDKRPYFFCAGIVSFGPLPCGREGRPDIYTRVSSYIDWIETNIRA